ncbi:MAG: O-antigen ligase family protein [Rhodospirillales bacterium]|nr:O-antigen ligase family protein [Rhodospirillales bacterium]
MLQFLVVIPALLLAGLAMVRPWAGLVLWVLALATGPDYWLSGLTGTPEATAGLLKAYGLAVLAGAALRGGLKTNRWNPAFAFLFMFCTGLLHGLHPGLSLQASLRSLVGSTAPFLFSFVRLDETFRRRAIAALIWAPVFAVAVDVVLALSGVDQLYVLEQGALRLGGNGQPPFLGGFALIGFYATVLELADKPRPGMAALAGLNFVIILLTGARSPLALAVMMLLALLLLQKRLMALAGAGALASLMVLGSGLFGFLRAVDLTKLGEATDLSHRMLVWPFFINAMRQSPWLGWGVGAGKVILPVTSQLSALLGTNAAHDEYLRIGSEGGFVGLLLLIGLMALWAARGSSRLPRGQAWLMRLTFIAFAIQSITDNTLIASTGSAFFLWASVIFADAENRSKRAACSPAAPPLPFPSPSPPQAPPWPIPAHPPSPSC